MYIYTCIYIYIYIYIYVYNIYIQIDSDMKNIFEQSFNERILKDSSRSG